MYFFFIFTAAVICNGCGQPYVDASTETTMQESIKQIRSGLKNDQRTEFDAALSDLNDMLFNRTDAVSQATISRYRPEALMRKILHRKNAREIVLMVEQHRRLLLYNRKQPP